MLRVDSTKPCQIIYAVCRHEYLSYVIEPHIVQLNPNGEFSLTYQRLFSNTAKEFSQFLDETDFKLVKVLEEMEQGNIIKNSTKSPSVLSSFSARYLTNSFLIPFARK